MNHNRILLVEDNKNISKVIKAYLEKENFNVLTAFDGKAAIDLFSSREIDLIILDLMIPIISGEEVCSIIRKESNVPIIMLTAKVDLDNKIDGLSMGADDYMTKPFEIKELLYRVKALLRRSYPISEGENVITIGENIKVYPDKYLVTKDDNDLDLTPNEFKVLLTFLSNPDQILSREQLIELSFGMDYDGYDRTIDTYIKNIRQKIELNPKKPEYIKTVYGTGYIYSHS